ncbi:zinc CCCH type domain-containing protein [Cryptosporidium andersoni]|uniref:Zinc CCCH type domain-containing protein n=1 Tax=Cryptosporidium andersoni TaxID=117008 RepID=A0A1J4MRP3_9CRYT|nr:zinc CCCH type domain-containing protein [Cryptosporidium andersoni]
MFKKRKIPKPGNLRLNQLVENQLSNSEEISHTEKCKNLMTDIESKRITNNTTNSKSKEQILNTEDLLQDHISIGYKSDRVFEGISDIRKLYNGDTIDTDHYSDARSILEKNEQMGLEVEQGKLKYGIYRGKDAYVPVIKRREGAVAASKYSGAYGPIRSSSTNVRLTLRIDYQPDICKDYKETGYCGFGDTCKFLHDRSDYKSGWQLEKEWEDQQKKKKNDIIRYFRSVNSYKDTFKSSLENNQEIYEDEDDIPFACLICKQKWDEDSNPVVTTCSHYYCEKCAFKHYTKTSKCFQCHSPTNGIFNTAEKIIEKVKKNHMI